VSCDRTFPSGSVEGTPETLGQVRSQSGWCKIIPAMAPSRKVDPLVFSRLLVSLIQW
jgi:hypothetical protein